MANLFGIPEQELLVQWLKSKILAEIGDEYFAREAINLVSEELTEYARHLEVIPVAHIKQTNLLVLFHQYFFKK
jgi:hypothetical protein